MTKNYIKNENIQINQHNFTKQLRKTCLPSKIFKKSEKNTKNNQNVTKTTKTGRKTAKT